MEKKEKEILLEERKYNLLPFHEHICSHLYCQPKNNPQINDKLFLCKYGQFHLCLAECYEEEVCPISGCSNGYIEIYTDAYKQDHHKRPCVSGEDVILQIEEIVEQLLYSHYRNIVNNNWVKKQQKCCKKEKNVYITQHYKTKPINLIQILMIESKYNNYKLPLQILQRDSEKIANYSHLVYQMYTNIKQYVQEKICIASITLCVLYKMQQGFSIDGVCIIPLDPYLTAHLPLINDLPQFGLDKKKFTKGEKIIKQLVYVVKSSFTSLNNISLKEKEEEKELVTFLPTSRKKLCM